MAVDAAIVWVWVAAALAPAAGWLLVRRLPRLAAWAVLGVLGIGYGLFVWGFLIEPELIAVRRVTVISPAWTGPDIRIGVVSDTHVGAPHVTAARVSRTMARLSAERPDLAVFLGDYAGGHEPAAGRSERQNAEILKGARALAEVRAPLGKVAVLGNHDWWYDGPALEAQLRRSGVTVLENDAVRIERPGGAFWVAGLADPHSTRARPSVIDALAPVPPDGTVILLTHPPDPFAQVPDRVPLTLAGHTHCGQVNLPLLGRPILPSPGSARWPCGLYVEGGRQMYVTGGVGVSVLPVRFRARPEIVVITVRASTSPGRR